MQVSDLNRRYKVFVPLLVLLGVVIRIAIAISFKHGDGDPYAWQRVANALEHRQNFYLMGWLGCPVWAILCGCFLLIQKTLGLSGIASFHVIVTCFLTIVDLAFSWVLYRTFGLAAGLLYFLAPTVMVVTGFQTQPETFALFLGFLAFLYLRKEAIQPNRENQVCATLLLALSLLIKADLIFFPFWLLFWSALGSLKKRIFICFIPICLLVLSFIPFVHDPQVFVVLKHNVSEHTAAFPGVVYALMDLVAPRNLWEQLFQWVPILNGIKFIWFCLMMGTGILVARKSPENMFFYFVIAMIAFTPCMWAYHLAIATSACAIFNRRWSFLLFLFFGGLLEIGRLPLSTFPVHDLSGQWYLGFFTLSQQRAPGFSPLLDLLWFNNNFRAQLLLLVILFKDLLFSNRKASESTVACNLEHVSS